MHDTRLDEAARLPHDARLSKSRNLGRDVEVAEPGNDDHPGGHDSAFKGLIPRRSAAEGWFGEGRADVASGRAESLTLRAVAISCSLSAANEAFIRFSKSAAAKDEPETSTRNATSNEQALARLVARKHEIDTMLARLRALSDGHFGLSPDEITWAT